MTPEHIIRRLVTNCGSQKKAAKMLGISHASVSRILHGKQNPSLPVLKLAEMLIQREGEK